jgi:hypothetical protein
MQDVSNLSGSPLKAEGDVYEAALAQTDKELRQLHENACVVWQNHTSRIARAEAEERKLAEDKAQQQQAK